MERRHCSVISARASWRRDPGDAPYSSVRPRRCSHVAFRPTAGAGMSPRLATLLGAALGLLLWGGTYAAVLYANAQPGEHHEEI